MVDDESAFDSLGQGVDGRSQPHRFLFSFEDASLEVGERSGDRGLDHAQLLQAAPAVPGNDLARLHALAESQCAA
jgi:hypothetical protein